MIQAELEIDFKELIIQYQKVLNTQLIETFGSPHEIEKHYELFFKNSIFEMDKKAFDKFIETNLLYKKLNCFEQYQAKVAELVSNFNFGKSRLIEYNEKKVVLSYIENNLYQQLRAKISCYKKYDILIGFYTLASYISELSQRIYSLYEFKDTKIEKHQLKENEDKILYTVRTFFKESAPQIGSIIGTDKRISELLLNIALFDDISYGTVDIKKINFADIYVIAYYLLNILCLKNAILSNLSEENWIEFNHSGFIISEDITQKLGEIAENSYLTEGNKVDVYNERLCDIYDYIKGKLKFSPVDLEKYIFSSNKQVKDYNLSICVDRHILEEDIKSITGVSDIGAKNMVNNLLLGHVAKEEILDTIFSDNKRAFRAPIIQLRELLLISFPLMVEASRSFRYRILKREIINDDKINNLIKRLFDEFDLSKVSLLCDSAGISFKQNWDLAKELKNVEFTKGISKEVDFAFVVNKVLFIVQLKDKKMRLDTKGILNERRDALKDIQKYKNTCEFIVKNLPVVQKSLNEEIVSLKPYFLFTRYNPVIDLEISKGDIKIMLTDDFLQGFPEIIIQIK